MFIPEVLTVPINLGAPPAISEFCPTLKSRPGGWFGKALHFQFGGWEGDQEC